MVEPKPNDKIIALGSGSGAMVNFVRTFGANVLGVDISPIAAEVATKLWKGTFLVRDVSDLYDIKDETFDKALAIDIVEHISGSTFNDMLKEAYRVLKRGGILAIYTPCPTHIIERFKKYNFILKQDSTHISIKTMKEIKFALKTHGFKVDLAYYTESPFPVINRIEHIFKPIPLVGSFFRYRICVRGIKS